MLFKTIMSESIARFKRPENQSEYKLKKKIDDWGNANVLEILTRCLAINTEFLLAFYKSDSQMRVFGRIVKPWLELFPLLKQVNELSDSCLIPSDKFFSYIMTKKVIFDEMMMSAMY
jgi:hypothetical protein